MGHTKPSWTPLKTQAGASALRLHLPQTPGRLLRGRQPQSSDYKQPVHSRNQRLTTSRWHFLMSSSFRASFRWRLEGNQYDQGSKEPQVSPTPRDACAARRDAAGRRGPQRDPGKSHRGCLGDLLEQSGIAEVTERPQKADGEGGEALETHSSSRGRSPELPLAAAWDRFGAATGTSGRVKASPGLGNTPRQEDGLGLYRASV